MKTLFISALFSLLLVVPSVFADCPTAPTGPYVVGSGAGSYSWYVYSQDQDCYSTSGTVYSTTVSCSYYPGWQFLGYSSAVASFPVSGTQTLGNDWEVSSFVEFNGTSWSDQVAIAVTVVHPNSTETPYTIFSWSGTDGTLNGCAEQGGAFTAEDGDTVYVQVSAVNYSNSTIRVSTPRIFNVSHP